ncbi:MAG: universal stress protein [Candidatus Obscuribacterales bacterium]|nr:universal stress protein [Candidatus Obscuribacterales bacterium]
MKVLVAIDDSTCSKDILEYVGKLLWKPEDQFVVLTVLEPVPMDFGLGNPPLSDEAFDQGLYDQCADLTAQAGLTIKKFLPDNHVEAKVLVGHPVDQICRCAESFDSDLLILGSHGRKGFQKFLLGSVAEEVLKKAPCSVAIFKAKVKHEKNKENSSAVTGNA